jgi:hypothetical protein
VAWWYRNESVFKEIPMGQLNDASTQAHAYGYLEYDVPKERQSVYNRLRDRLRRISMMRTWSVYLVRLEYRDQVLAILKDLDNDADTKARRSTSG